jgi:hypothetical protein
VIGTGLPVFSGEVANTLCSCRTYKEVATACHHEHNQKSLRAVSNHTCCTGLAEVCNMVTGCLEMEGSSSGAILVMDGVARLKTGSCEISLYKGLAAMEEIGALEAERICFGVFAATSSRTVDTLPSPSF